MELLRTMEAQVEKLQIALRSSAPAVVEAATEDAPFDKDRVAALRADREKRVVLVMRAQGMEILLRERLAHDEKLLVEAVRLFDGARAEPRRWPYSEETVSRLLKH